MNYSILNNFLYKELSVAVEPHQMTVEFSNEARLYAVVNEEDQKILEFQWFKFNTSSNQFESISGTD